MSKLSGFGHKLYTGEVSYDFIGRRRRWYVISAVIVLICLGSVLLRGLSFGIEFTGGADFRVSVAQADEAATEKLTTAVRESGVPELDEMTVTTLGNDTVRIQTRDLDPETEVPVVRAALAEAAGVDADEVTYSLIGASWGDQITERAALALVVFLVLVGLVIWAYFRNWKMSVAAMAALIHDLVVTIGVYALVGFTITPATLIGVLTILGYSLYDTVVVFDKVRENVRDLSSSATKTYSEASNLAVNQVLVRSINTTIIGVLPVAALLFTGSVFLGTGPLKDLSLALFVGMVSGAYSSIFLATPLLAQLKEREPEMIKLRKRVELRRAKTGARTGEPVLAGAGAAGGAPTITVTSAEVSPSENADGASEPEVGESTTSSEPSTKRTKPLSEGGANRPQPRNAPRSSRKKKQ
ncbi:MAG: protein translocase subunit SecF [Propionibacteriaceae bacterium]